jgi:hypothetical protein
MMLFKKKNIYNFRLHEDFNNEDNLVIILILEANIQIIINDFYFAYEGSIRVKNLSDLNLIFLKIQNKLKSFNLINTGDFNCNILPLKNSQKS